MAAPAAAAHGTVTGFLRSKIRGRERWEVAGEAQVEAVVFYNLISGDTPSLCHILWVTHTVLLGCEGYAVCDCQEVEAQRGEVTSLRSPSW